MDIKDLKIIIIKGDTEYLGRFDEINNRIYDAVERGKSPMSDWLKAENLGRLMELKLSPVSDYAITELKKDEWRTFERLCNIMEQAKEEGPARIVNKAFDDLRTT